MFATRPSQSKCYSISQQRGAAKCETTTSIAFRPMDTQGVRCFNVPRKFGKPRDSHTEYRELVQRQWNLAHAHQGKPPN